MANFIDKHEPEWSEVFKDIFFQEKGISREDAKLLYSLCRKLGVEIVLESGTGPGVSAEVFAKLGVPVVTCDLRAEEGKPGYNYDDCVNRLFKYDNVRILWGNSFGLFPLLLKQYAGKRIALFIDGPKRGQALSLAIRSLDVSNDIVMIGTHDVNTPELLAAYSSYVQSIGWKAALRFLTFCMYRETKRD